MKNLSIEERIVESNLFYFDDGYLGSTGHGACYYDDNIDGIEEIKSENDLMCLIINFDLFRFLNLFVSHYGQACAATDPLFIVCIMSFSWAGCA